jgi:hypothetical protein
VVRLAVGISTDCTSIQAFEDEATFHYRFQFVEHRDTHYISLRSISPADIATGIVVLVVVKIEQYLFYIISQHFQPF